MHITVQEFYVGKYGVYTNRPSLDYDAFVTAVCDFLEHGFDYYDPSDEMADVIDIHALAIYYDDKKEKFICSEMQTFLQKCLIEKWDFQLNQNYNVKL